MEQNLTQAELWTVDALKWRKQEEGMRALYDEIIQSIKIIPKSSVLDIGCGTGFFLSLLQKRDLVLHGLDISASQIEFAKNQSLDGDFQIADMEQLPFDKESIDLIVANNSLQFASNVEKAISEMYRVLRPGKQCVVTLWDEPSKSDAFCFFKVFYQLTNQALEYSIPFNLSKANDLENLLQKFGFKIDGTYTKIITRIYGNLDEALQAILSSGPANHAIQKTSYELVKNQVTNSIQDFLKEDGTYVFHNSFVYRMATKT